MANTDDAAHANTVEQWQREHDDDRVPPIAHIRTLCETDTATATRVQRLVQDRADVRTVSRMATELGHEPGRDTIAAQLGSGSGRATRAKNQWLANEGKAGQHSPSPDPESTPVSNDDEVTALSRITDLLAELPPDTRERVVRYVADRWLSR